MISLILGLLGVGQVSGFAENLEFINLNQIKEKILPSEQSMGIAYSKPCGSSDALVSFFEDCFESSISLVDGKESRVLRSNLGAHLLQKIQGGLAEIFTSEGLMRFFFEGASISFFIKINDTLRVLIGGDSLKLEAINVDIGKLFSECTLVDLFTNAPFRVRAAFEFALYKQNVFLGFKITNALIPYVFLALNKNIGFEISSCFLKGLVQGANSKDGSKNPLISFESRITVLF